MVAKRVKKNAVLLIGLAIMGLTIFSFMGCGSGGGSGSSSNNPTPAPTPPADIAVSKTQIEFGDVVANNLSEETVSIQNIGSSNLIIGQIAQANVLSPPFSIISDECSGMQLAPSHTCTLKVRFSPAIQGEFSDAFDIPSNDPNQNPVTVNVHGFGKALKVTINQVDTNACQVDLLISVTDKDSNPIAGLQQNHLSLYENGVPKGIANFHQATSAVSVALLSDYSGSMIEAGVISDLEAASKNFIDQLNANDEAGIIKFATDIIPMIPDPGFTTDKAALKAAIDTAYPGDTHFTHLYDAIWYAVEVTAARPNNPVIVLFSDGANDINDLPPGSPTKTLTEVIDYAKGRGVSVFTIGFGVVNEAVMNQLANETGGEYFLAPTAAQLNEIYQKIAEIIAGRYVIEYKSGGGTVTLDLEVNFNNMQGKTSKTITVTGCP